jgi:hypothetical protein
MRGLAVNSGFGKNPEKAVALMRRMGVSAVRWLPSEWAGVEKEKGVYVVPEWGQRTYDLLRKADIKVILLLFRRNTLYAESKGMDADAYARYAAFMAKTFTPPTVIAYELWNEPCNFDFPQYVGKRDVWIAKYCEMVRKASAAIREVDPKTPVLQTLEVQFWFDALRDHTADFAQIDGTVVHPYPTGWNPAERSPWAPPVTDAERSMVGYLNSHAVEFPKKYLGRELSVWATECGGFDKGSEEQKAAYQVRGLIQGVTGGVKAWCIWPFLVEGNVGLVRKQGDDFEPTPSYYALQRTARFLGPDWQAVPDAQCRLGFESEPEVALGKSRVTGPQVYWFRVGKEWITFVWNAGKYTIDRPPLGDLVWLNSPTVSRVEAQDVVTGQKVPVTLSYTNGLVTLSGVPVGSNPVAIRWTPSSK